MKQLSTVVYLSAAFLISFAPSLRAQKTSDSARSTATAVHDISEEVTITGTVSSVFAKPSPGMIAGSHLMVESLSGPVDASLGRFGLAGKGALSVAVGQQIEATGIMKTIKDKSIFVVRTLRVGGNVYTVRNKRGFPVSPQARKRAGESAGRTEESL